MNSRLRDGLLAIGVLGTLIAVAILTGAAGSLLRPGPATAGVVGAIVLEALFLRYLDRMGTLWERRTIQALAVVGVVGASVLAVRSGIDWVFAAFAWGLVAYLGLLGIVAGGFGNPVSRLAK